MARIVSCRSVRSACRSHRPKWLRFDASPRRFRNTQTKLHYPQKGACFLENFTVSTLARCEGWKKSLGGRAHEGRISPRPRLLGEGLMSQTWLSKVLKQ